MSAELEHGGFGHQHVAHQFEDIGQQNECYVVGMWTFLVTEIMFFGALFLALTIYRGIYNEDFHEAHTKLIVPLGLLNTFVLLTSSLFMAFGVQSAQLGKKAATMAWIGLTILCAFGFLGIKAVEYTTEFREHLFPGPTFAFEREAPTAGAHAGFNAIPATPEQLHAPTDPSLPAGYQTQQLSQDKKQLFFSLYFVMTGLHGFHVIIGILIMSALLVMIGTGHPAVNDYMPIEMTGLYWHFVDIVWIFLFPLVYLIGH
jgi:cytochrome c oxidase subunit 3